MKNTKTYHLTPYKPINFDSSKAFSTQRLPYAFPWARCEWGRWFEGHLKLPNFEKLLNPIWPYISNYNGQWRDIKQNFFFVFFFSFYAPLSLNYELNTLQTLILITTTLICIMYLSRVSCAPIYSCGTLKLHHVRTGHRTHALPYYHSLARAISYR